MKYRSLSLFIAVTVVFIILHAEVSANNCSNKNIKASVRTFITQYYEDLKGGDRSKIKQYFFEKPDRESINALTRAGRVVSRKPLDEEELEHMIHIGKLLAETLDKIEFLEITIISKKPLIIEVDLLIWYRSDDPYGRDDEVLFILKNTERCTWKIVDESAPGLP